MKDEPTNQESNATNALGLAILLAANGFAWLVIWILIGWGGMVMIPTDEDYRTVGQALRHMLDEIEEAMLLLKEHSHLIRKQDYTFEGCATGESE